MSRFQCCRVEESSPNGKCYPPSLTALRSEAHWVMIYYSLTLSTSLIFGWETMAGWVRCHCFWFLAHPRSFFFLLLTWMTEAAVYDYKFWLGFLAMQEESNPLWFNNFLPHFGTITNTCTEVSPSTDHQDVRWQSSCAGLVQISAEFLLSLESMTVRTFFFTEKGKENNEEKKKNDHLISPHTDQSTWRSLTT